VEVIKRLDPTDFKSRFETRTEYQSLQSGGSRTVLVPRYEHAFSKTLSLRVDLNYVWNDPNQPGSEVQSGIGDTVVRLAYRAMRKPGYALVLAPEVSFDTAESDLGANATIFQPFAFAAIDMPQFKSVFFPYVQQYVSIAGDADVNTTLLRTGLLTRWPKRFYSFLEPSLYIDWESDGRTGSTLELEMGRLITRDLSIWVRPGVGLWGDNLRGIYNWNFEVGFRYFLD
jgi:hypothetical protein